MTLIKALALSDDLPIHVEAFVEAAKILITSGHMKVQDFKDNGGWVKSTDFKDSYFVYPTYNLHIQFRYYFDVVKQEIFQCRGTDKIILYRRKNGPRNAPYIADSN